MELNLLALTPTFYFYFINILFYIIIDYIFGFSSALFDLSTCDILKCILSAQKYHQVCHFKLKIKVFNQDLKNTYKEHVNLSAKQKCTPNKYQIK